MNSSLPRTINQRNYLGLALAPPRAQWLCSIDLNRAGQVQPIEEKIYLSIFHGAHHCLPVPGTLCVGGAAESQQIYRTPPILVGVWDAEERLWLQLALEGFLMGTNSWRVLCGSQTLQLLIKENSLGIHTTPQVRKFAGKSRREAAAAGLGKGQGGAECKCLDPQHMVPCSFPRVYAAHPMPHRQGKAHFPPTSLTGGQRP